MCWICLDDTKDRDVLVSPCRCPRKVHPRCLARWQLQQAGRLEETNCRCANLESPVLWFQMSACMRSLLLWTLCLG